MGENSCLIIIYELDLVALKWNCYELDILVNL